MKSLKKYEIRELLNFGQVGAGKVVPFTPREERIPVAIPSHYPNDESIGTVTVCGPSLSDLGIYDNDVLIVKRKVSRRAITEQTICILYIIPTGELVAKRVRHSERGITLLSSGGGAKNRFFEHDAIEVRGIVVGFQRMFADGQCPEPLKLDLPF